MMPVVLDLLKWLVVAAVLIALLSSLGLRSYRRFAAAARGPVTLALPPGGAKTALDLLFDPAEAAHPGKSGLANLLHNHEAFVARSLSAAEAGRSLDLMYYIWRTDLTGWLLLADLLAAADRGVRVRLLLDDVNVQGFDPTFLALNQHPNIAVRLFNPTRNRGHVVRRVVEMVLGLSQFNRRMHGKLWIADGRLAITGGRNIGDTYFGALGSGDRMSRDADVMLVGGRVADLASVFDGYWNLGLALPIVKLWPKVRIKMRRFRRRVARHVQDDATRRYLTEVGQGKAAAAVLTAPLRWTDTVEILADPPEKAYGERPSPWMSEAIAAVLAGAQHEVQLVTPYLVPGKRGERGLAALGARGVQVSIVTNALAATDMVWVHGAYRHYRAPLLASGARIHEFSPIEVLPGRREMLHSKVFIIDGRQAVVGSLNFDLRSAHINTELGLRFEEPELVAELQAMFAELCTPEQSYAVSLHPGGFGGAGRICWSAARPGVPSQSWVEPEALVPLRAVSWVMGRLPIQAYL